MEQLLQDVMATSTTLVIVHKLSVTQDKQASVWMLNPLHSADAHRKAVFLARLTIFSRHRDPTHGSCEEFLRCIISSSICPRDAVEAL